MLDIDAIRKDFPILDEKVYGKPLVYLDNAATTQKPQIVLDTIIKFYTRQNSNIHRGVHYLSEQASLAYEKAREKVRDFINAKALSEIVFTSGTTEAINLVANSFGDRFVNAGDEIIVTEMEHHSNIVPWQILCEHTNAELRIVPFEDNGTLLLDELKKQITAKTKLLSVIYVSNVMGVINPIKEIISLAHAQDVPVLVDAAQAVQHIPVDVQDLDCDFLAFSGHKLYAETGIGVLYGKEKWLEAMPPFQSGGSMVNSVSFSKTTYADLPLKFEAGTGNYVAAASLGAAVEYVKKIGLDEITHYEDSLLTYATARLAEVEGLTQYGLVAERCAVVSFNIENIHPYDAGMILDKLGIAVRTGTHCAEPVMQHFGIDATIRASFAFYNTKEEIDKLIAGLHKARTMLGG
jgi:cysteine desulfurase/selenocysteine lyase